jgi:pimeloyl-ACP methyl ester carboxylesterase
VNNFRNLIWHKYLGRPFRLAKVIDNGQGQTVVLLHGIGQTGQVWRHVIDEFQNLSLRVVAFDLLGFGSSPKPDWLDYNVDDHAKTVIASIEDLEPDKPVIIVGHSMGCLIAVRVARLRPDLVSHLVLYEMPLYNGLPEKRIYRLRLNAYARFYSWVINYQPSFNELNSTKIERLAQSIIGFEVTKDTWEPFIKSLSNTIMAQTTAKDITQINAPMDVIYGLLDIVVIKGKTKHIFGEDKPNINIHSVAARHTISKRASKLIVSRVSLVV